RVRRGEEHRQADRLISCEVRGPHSRCPRNSLTQLPSPRVRSRGSRHSRTYPETRRPMENERRYTNYDYGEPAMMEEHARRTAQAREEAQSPRPGRDWTVDTYKNGRL